MIEPLPLEYSEAAPAIERFNEMQQWVLARRELGPIGRHGLYVLELTDALDMTVDTFICALLHGETDTSGYPDYNAIVGGLASHWDELSGELVVRPVVGWGGKGLRGDTERIGQKLVSSLYQQVIASGLQPGSRRTGAPASIGGRIGPGLRALRLRGAAARRPSTARSAACGWCAARLAGFRCGAVLSADRQWSRVPLSVGWVRLIVVRSVTVRHTRNLHGPSVRPARPAPRILPTT